jgi:hypothetical protein
MAWWYAVVESQHELQNPTSPEKIRLLGERLELGPESHLLDIAGGRGGPASLMVREFGCRVTLVELAPEFAEVARQRDERLEVIESDAKDFAIEPGGYDAAMCLGATFAFDGLVPTVRTLAQAVPTRGLIAVGEPYWRVWPLPEGLDASELGLGAEDFVPLAETGERFESGGVELVSLIASSQDDWDRYESLHWATLDEWLAANRDDPQAEEFRERGRRERERHLRWRRELMGWAIFVGRVQ